MLDSKIEITITINDVKRKFSVDAQKSLLLLLREASYFSVKSGCDTVSCGVCTVLLDGKPIRSCNTKAVDVDGRSITTLEGLSQNGQLHPLQRAFINSGAIQCGFSTPGLILTAKALLDKNPNPTDEEIRRALTGVICRCTGYVRTVEAVRKAAAMLRGEEAGGYTFLDKPLPEDITQVEIPEAFFRREGGNSPLPPIVYSPVGLVSLKVVGKPEEKVDARKLALGKPVYAGDLHMEGMLYGALLTSPHAHAFIRSIDASRARALPGVHAVLTWQNIPRVKFSSSGQSYPQPLPYDQVSLDNKVRHVGDRVAVVAAESAEIAQQALELIQVEYEVLPAVVDPEAAMQPGAPVIHDETDVDGIYDAAHNIVAHVETRVGDVDKAFKEAEHVFQGEYRTPKQQHVHLEPHVCITWLDENDRLVIRSSNQVPFHIRRMVAPLIGLPVKKIRVIKPRIGGGFGNKQELVLEDLCAHLTLKTGRPVKMEYTRTQEFTSSRSRHALILRYKVGVTGDKVTAISLDLVGNTGAYGTHGLSVNMVAGFKGLTLYNPDNIRFTCDVVYTNTPPAGAFRGYGTMQAVYGIEVLMAEIADKLGLDPADFKRKNWLQVGEVMNLSKELGEGREGTEQYLSSSALDQCLAIGMKVTDFAAKAARNRSQTGRLRKGIGFAVTMHGSGVAAIDLAAATMKMNDDGSFNLLIGASDLGTGSDTVLGQIAAEVLGIPLEDLIITSSDTDFTPFDKGAYASSTTYVSGGAVLKAAHMIKQQIQEHAALMLEFPNPEALVLQDRRVLAPDGRSLALADVALHSLHMANQRQIMATASHTSPLSPPPTGAQFAEIEVDTETGKIKVERLLMVVDCGRVINPMTAAGQVEGAMAQGLGFSLTEEMLFNEEGQPLNANLIKYRVPRASDMPALDVIFVQTEDPTGPFGAKSVGEVSIDGVAPSITIALHNAAGVWAHEVPLTQERVRQALAEHDNG